MRQGRMRRDEMRWYEDVVGSDRYGGMRMRQEAEAAGCGGICNINFYILKIIL